MGKSDAVILAVVILMIIALMGGCVSASIQDEKDACLTLYVAYPNLTFEYSGLSCNLIIDGVPQSISTDDVLILQKLNNE